MRGRARVQIVLWAQIAVLAASGCASSSKGELSKLRRRLDELAQNDSATQRRVEELNNRLFLLEDKVETTKVAAGRVDRPPRLPVVRIRPQDVEPDDVEPDDVQPRPERGRVVPRRPGRQTKVVRDPVLSDSDPAEGGSANADPGEVAPEPAASAGPGDGRKSLVVAHGVSYGGPAGRANGPRPVLKLHGGSTRSAAPAAPVVRSRRGRGALSSKFDASQEKLPVVPVPSRATVAAAKLYSRAMKQYQSGRYGAAAAAFRGFLGRHTKHAYADNALYWLGECFYDLKKFRTALKMFRRVVEQYPNGNKAPDALLKMGYSYLRLQERANARNVLAQVVEIFPKSNSARLASSALTRLQ